jgi:hypothetical protein
LKIFKFKILFKFKNYDNWNGKLKVNGKLGFFFLMSRASATLALCPCDVIISEKGGQVKGEEKFTLKGHQNYRYRADTNIIMSKVG